MNLLPTFFSLTSYLRWICVPLFSFQIKEYLFMFEVWDCITVKYSIVNVIKDYLHIFEFDVL